MGTNAKPSREQALAASNDMVPVEGSVEVDIPVALLWKAFMRADAWPRWNKCFFWAKNKELKLGDKLIWCFQPIRWWMPYKMPASATIVELEKERKVTWEVTVLPGFYARHTYFMEDLGGGRTRFGSWEKATGFSFRLMKAFWIAHFRFVKDRSLEGARRLEEAYREDGKLDVDHLPSKRRWLFIVGMLLLLGLLAAGIFAGWFYFSFLKMKTVELAPGVYAVLDGGCNSLVIKDGGETLVVDSKFPPMSGWFKDRVADEIGGPVTAVVNTHYHFDHTQGNIHYPGARIIAHAAAPELQKKEDGVFWALNRSAMPDAANAVSDASTIKVGAQEVKLSHPGPAHTKGDLWVYLKKGDVEVVATGDLVFNGYYPFFDTSPGGADIPGMIKAIRDLAGAHPKAVFVPGHGPLATADDLRRYADYLDKLYTAVEGAVREGLSEDQAAARIRPSLDGRSILPIYHYGTTWSTADTNVRSVYQIIKR